MKKERRARNCVQDALKTKYVESTVSQNNNTIAEAINLAEVSTHSIEAIIALIETVRRQEEQIRSLIIRKDRDYE